MAKDTTKYNGTVKFNTHEDSRYPFYTFVPENAKMKNILVWGHGSVGSEEVEILKQEIYKQFEYHCPLFDELGIVAIMPILPRRQTPNFQGDYDSQILDRTVMMGDCEPYFLRPDIEILKIVAIVQKEMNQNGIEIYDKFIVGGASSGAVMANRMTLLYPERILGSLLYHPGIFTYPERVLDDVELPYPFGVSDINKFAKGRVTGAFSPLSSLIRFDKKAFLNVPTFIFVGDEETDSRKGPFNFEVRHHLDIIDKLKKIVGINPLDISQKYAKYLKENGGNFVLKVKANRGHKCYNEDIKEGFEFLGSFV